MTTEGGGWEESVTESRKQMAKEKKLLGLIRVIPRIERGQKNRIFRRMREVYRVPRDSGIL